MTIIDDRLVGACFRAKSDDLLIRLYRCGSNRTRILTGENRVSTLIETNIENVICDFINSADIYELTETKRFVKADVDNQFYETTQLDHRRGGGISKRVKP
jgi:hypothetical protein